MDPDPYHGQGLSQDPGLYIQILIMGLIAGFRTRDGTGSRQQCQGQDPGPYQGHKQSQVLENRIDIKVKSRIRIRTPDVWFPKQIQGCR